MDIEKKIIEILQDQLGLQTGEINRDSTLESLGMDSLDNIEVLMAIEHTFNLDIPDADAEKLITVKDATAYVADLLGGE